MEYELAKHLKDAGFPQDGANFNADGETRGYYDGDGGEVYLPTLRNCGLEGEAGCAIPIDAKKSYSERDQLFARQANLIRQ